MFEFFIATLNSLIGLLLASFSFYQMRIYSGGAFMKPLKYLTAVGLILSTQQLLLVAEYFFAVPLLTDIALTTALAFMAYAVMQMTEEWRRVEDGLLGLAPPARTADKKP